jgi:hypothetical protein
LTCQDAKQGLFPQAGVTNIFFHRIQLRLFVVVIRRLIGLMPADQQPVHRMANPMQISKLSRPPAVHSKPRDWAGFSRTIPGHSQSNSTYS